MICCTVNCGRAALFTVYWPGQTRVMCRDCCERAVRLAAAMGFNLTIGPATP